MLSCKEKNQCSFNQILCFYSRIRIHLGNRYKNFKAPILYFLNSFYFVAFLINIHEIFLYPLSLPLLHYIVSFFSGNRMCIQYSKSSVYKKYISWVKSILINKIQQCVFPAKSAIQIEMAVCMTWHCMTGLYFKQILDVGKLKVLKTIHYWNHRLYLNRLLFSVTAFICKSRFWSI